MWRTSLLAAILPTLFLVWTIWWADRYEREPGKLLLSAFLWGAVPAILLAAFAEVLLTLPFRGGSLGNQIVGTAFIAPFVEEGLKGLALALLWRRYRAEIDGMLDGIIYGAMVGAGFAMTENFFYFLGESDPQSLHTLIFLRSGVFGWNHIFFTGVFGASVGWAAQQRSKMGQFLGLWMGFGVAVALHMMHNLSAVLSQVSPLFILFSTFLLWSGLFLFLGIVILLLARERRAIRAYLAGPEAPDLTPQERAHLLSTLPPWERFVPARLLPRAARQRAAMYQQVAEAALLQRRLQSRS